MGILLYPVPASQNNLTLELNFSRAAVGTSISLVITISAWLEFTNSAIALASDMESTLFNVNSVRLDRRVKFNALS